MNEHTQADINNLYDEIRDRDEEIERLRALIDRKSVCRERVYVLV